jgi:8-oxo-dGTP pyrophosphatase MutT (NUDIX family)
MHDSSRDELTSRLLTYSTPFSEEEIFRMAFLELIKEPNSFFRTHFEPGHFTASAWVVNTQRTHTLLLRHAKLNRWLQPGGHADGVTDVANVAQRELAEETGLSGRLASSDFFDLDIHLIPARKNEPSHRHFDFRFLLVVEDHLPLQGNEESMEVRWVPLAGLEHVNPDDSMLRLRAKTHSLSW